MFIKRGTILNNYEQFDLIESLYLFYSYNQNNFIWNYAILVDQRDMILISICFLMRSNWLINYHLSSMVSQ